MNNSDTFMTVNALSEKRSSILIDEVYAESLFRFLVDREFQALPPNDAIYRTKRFYKDRNGKINMESEPTDMEIIVAASPSDIEAVLEEWLATIK